MYQDQDAVPAEEQQDSGIYRAFSGSVEAAGATESEAIETLDRNLRRSSTPPGDAWLEATDSEQELQAASDTDHCPQRFQSMLPPATSNVPDTVRAPCLSALPAVLFTGVH